MKTNHLDNQILLETRRVAALVIPFLVAAFIILLDSCILAFS